LAAAGRAKATIERRRFADGFRNAEGEQARGRPVHGNCGPETGGRAAREQLYDRSMPLFETRDAKAALKAAAEAIDAGRPFPKMAFEGR